MADKLQKQPRIRRSSSRTAPAAPAASGVNAVKNAAPDGMTLLYTPFAAVTIYPFVYSTLDYDPFTDLTPISQICTFDFAIAVGPNSRRQRHRRNWWPGLRPTRTKAQFGSPGAGALPHFFGLMFGQAADVEMTHIAYKGSTPVDRRSSRWPDSTGVVDHERVCRVAPGRQNCA